MAHQSNVMQAYVTRFDPEPIKEDVPKETKESEESLSASSDQAKD